MARAKRSRPARAAGAAANAARGEHTLVLGGKSYRLRPSFAAIVAFEEELGRSALELLREANGGALGFMDLGTICAECIRAGAAEDDKITRLVSAEGIAEKIFEEGVTPVLVTVTLLLADAVSGGRTASGEAKAVTASEKGTSTPETVTAA